MRVFISGIRGNMAQRYKAICHYINKYEFKVDVIGLDKDYSFVDQSKLIRETKADRIIIATPSATHGDAIQLFNIFSPGIPMLCEKPIAMHPIKIDKSFNLRMVNQYEYLVKPDSVGRTYYNYFKTGSDPWPWDFINIIGLAKGPIELHSDSYQWICEINGHPLNIQDMDNAYYSMVRDWLLNPTENIDYIHQAHRKVKKYIEDQEAKENSTEMTSKVIPILRRGCD